MVSTACTIACSRSLIASRRATGFSAICVGQDARSSSAALADTALRFSHACSCCSLGLTVCSMRWMGSFVKLSACRLQSEARLPATELPRVPAPFASAPMASSRCLCSSFREAYKVARGGRTIWIACIVASSRFSTASSRPSGVSGASLGQEALTTALALDEAASRSSSAATCSPVG